MFNFSKTQKKYTRYIIDYEYPVGMDTRPTTLGVADNIFGRQNYYRTLSIRQFFSGLFIYMINAARRFFQRFKVWRGRL
ncbi:hypothetical protein TH53_14055 [Pedobacter lusitanus]|uniref:Uncharacterized protein n=1 Tax=Pedobacter lusitanus TaxID=1503925 RepID=A0A0D0FVS2_9SPHI|nr:hypothetical protein [Pedobacter lusitanus]KIO76569.1 hypothetical protein TH53_14055 [Pedobacter lusitanus]